MSDRIEGLEPKRLMRAVLDSSPSEADLVRAAQAEARVRAKVEHALPDLELLELLGSGGMGHVYRARQPQLDREVALKVVAPEGEHADEFAERFEREARALARLRHPGIVSVHDYGRTDDLCWIVMEYVDGSSLRDVIRAGKLEPAEALALVPKLCDALQYAHDQGVVHRDVKPENILLDRDGAVKVADFGLAKLVRTTDVGLTGSGQVLGTFRYMAPEQLDRPRTVDHRADIYSLGVVFYEMLTGEIPMGRFDPPSQHSHATPGLDRVVLRALEKERDRRYQHASDVKTDLEHVDDEPAVERGVAPTDVPDGSVFLRHSLGAYLSAALFALGLAPFVGVVPVLLNASGSGGASLAILFAVGVGLLGVVLQTTGSVVGAGAIRDIRAAWPTMRGLAFAVVGAWGPLLVLLDVVLVAVAFRSIGMAPSTASRLVVLGMVLALDAAAVFALHRFHRRGLPPAVARPG